ncbi:MAG TPA: phage holin family protein [Actinopolymorphaceae bacterium]
MTTNVPRQATRRSPDGEPSLGELFGDLTSDLQRLFRQEVELAKAEVKDEASKAGKAAGMLGGAGFAGYMTIIFVSLAAMFALSNWVGIGWAALIVAGVWAVIGLILYAVGRSRLRTVSGPTKTVDSLKEDAQWARHPTRSDTTSSAPEAISAQTSSASPTERALPE